MGRWIAAADPALCDPSVTQSRVGTHWSGAQYLRDALFKGRNIQELSVGDTSVGDTSTLHRVKRPFLGEYTKCVVLQKEGAKRNLPLKRIA
jgi:hypothetical protein